MVALPVAPGPSKRDIINRAYGICGKQDWVFGLEPEEVVIGLQCLNDQMALIGPQTGYIPPASGDGLPDDDSGIDPSDVLGVSAYVARLLAPMVGKTLSLSGAHARAESVFIAKYTTVPIMELGRQTIRGAGQRWQNWYGAYFVTDTSPDEPTQ